MSPPIATVFRKPHEGIYHTRCRQPVQFRGTRGGVEVDFYCLCCYEHVTLPEHLLPRIPIYAPGQGIV